MKLFFVFSSLLCCLAAAQNAVSTTSQEASEAAAAAKLLLSMPKCGLACLQTAVAASSCSPTDLACSCSNMTLQAQVQVCVATSCTLRDALTTKNTSTTLCHPDAPIRDQSAPLVYIAMVGLGIAVLSIILRMSARFFIAGGFFPNIGSDDVCILVALVLIGGISGCAFILAENGLGKDIWTVPFTSITKLLHIYYVNEILYIITLPLIKVSIIFTYLRIFPEKSFQWLAYSAIALNIAYVIAFLIVTVLQCSPISFAWNRWDKEHKGTCMDLNAQVMAAAAINIVLDLIVVAMPMPYLWRLQMSTRKKVMVMLMFSGGLFVVIVSILRLQFLILFAHSSNLTWDYREIGNWSIVEMDASVLCACLPGIRQLQKCIWPKLIASTTQRSNTRSTNTDVYARSESANGILDEQKGRTKVHSNFIPLDDIDWHSEPDRSQGETGLHQGSTSTLVTK